MTENHEQPNLDDVLEPAETVHPDHRDHAKTPKHVNENELDERTQLERDEVQSGG